MPTMSDDTIRNKKSHTVIWIITVVVGVLVAGGTFIGIQVLETKNLEDIKILEAEGFCENYKVGSATSEVVGFFHSDQRESLRTFPSLRA